MYENILASKANYERALRSARSELERKKINNERIDQFKKELAEDRTLYNEASKYVNAVKIVQTAVVKEARDYQTRRIDYLNDIITEAVGKIFPDRNVTAKLDCDFSRTDKVSLHLYDENGDSFSPRISEGTADVTWSSDKSIGDVISDNQDNINYVGEDQTYHCTLVRSDGKTGDVIGVKAQLVQ